MLRFLHTIALLVVSASLIYAQRIAGGSEATPGQAPYMVNVLIFADDTPGGYYVCGGGLISTRHVLTAAHCFGHQGINKILVIYGTNDRLTVNLNQNNASGLTYAVHPNYSSRSKQNDLAVVLLNVDVKLSDDVAVLELGSAVVGTRYTLAGWGETSAESGASRNLMITEIAVVADTNCASIYQPYNRDTQLCMNAGAPTDTCEGDSGGPVVIQNGGKYTTVGIVSYGPADCGTVAGEYAVYTRVSGFITWINQQINSLTLPPQNAPNPTITIRGSGASSLSTASCLLLAIIIAVMF